MKRGGRRFAAVLVPLGRLWYQKTRAPGMKESPVEPEACENTHHGCLPFIGRVLFHLQVHRRDHRRSARRAVPFFRPEPRGADLRRHPERSDENLRPPEPSPGPRTQVQGAVYRIAAVARPPGQQGKPAQVRTHAPDKGPGAGRADLFWGPQRSGLLPDVVHRAPPGHVLHPHHRTVAGARGMAVFPRRGQRRRALYGDIRKLFERIRHPRSPGLSDRRDER